MSIIDSLITDRTQSDIGRAAALKQKALKSGWDSLTVEEQTEYLAGMKGAYNATDLNRVGAACAYLQELFLSYGYHTPGYTELRTDWTAEEEPGKAYFATYLSTVSALKAVFHATQEIPDSMEGLTVEAANNIEKMLADTDELIRTMVVLFLRCAQFEMYSGYHPIPTAYSDCGRNWAELDKMETTWANWNAANWYLLLYGNMKAEA